MFKIPSFSFFISFSLLFSFFYPIFFSFFFISLLSLSQPHVCNPLPYPFDIPVLSHPYHPTRKHLCHTGASPSSMWRAATELLDWGLAVACGGRTWISPAAAPLYAALPPVGRLAPPRRRKFSDPRLATSSRHRRPMLHHHRVGPSRQGWEMARRSGGSCPFAASLGPNRSREQFSGSFAGVAVLGPLWHCFAQSIFRSCWGSCENRTLILNPLFHSACS
jgi:hypothetical protein